MEEKLKGGTNNSPFLQLVLGVIMTSNQKKISLNIDINLYNEIKAISESNSHPSLSRTITKLLTKAVYLEKENIYASTVQDFVRQEIEKLSQKVAEEITFATEEINRESIDLFLNEIHKSKCISLANLIALTNTVAVTNEEAEDMRKESLTEAFEGMERIDD